MTNNDASARGIAKELGICHRTVLQVRKKRNISASKTTLKKAPIAIGKPVREWTI